MDDATPDGLELVEIKDKGRCLRFTRSFAAGSMILKEPPFLFLPKQLSNALLLQTVESLGEAKRQSLFNGFEAHMDKVASSTQKFLEENPEYQDAVFLSQVLMTNAMRVGSDNLGLYLCASKAVHDCDPCCAYSTEAAKPDYLCMFALRDVSAGELVTICYLADADSLFRSTDNRRQALVDARKHFCCQCCRCHGPDVMRRIQCWECADFLCPSYKIDNDGAISDPARLANGQIADVEKWACSSCGLVVDEEHQRLKVCIRSERELESEASSLTDRLTDSHDCQALVKESRALVARARKELGEHHWLFCHCHLVALDILIAATHDTRFSKPFFLGAAISEHLGGARSFLDACAPQLVWQLSPRAALIVGQAKKLYSKADENVRKEISALVVPLWSEYGHLLKCVWGHCDADYQALQTFIELCRF